MKKGTKFLSADYSTADMVVSAILKLKGTRFWNNKPVDELFKAFKPGIGSKAEAERIVLYLIDDRVIVKDGDRYKWHGDVNVWDNVDRRRKYVLEMLMHADATKREVIHHPGRKTVSRAKKAAAEQVSVSPEQPIVQEPELEAPKLPEYAKLHVSPDQLTDAELDIAIQELQATLNAFVSEKNKRAEITAKKRELFKTVSELIAGEGFTLDEIMQIV
ncbi:MAG: hypothetical protein J6Y02_20185 [Pseudobutyrivibrio sp.]|nr:hypothetical protein [Pseudobutyrivibrio sp.]